MTERKSMVSERAELVALADTLDRIRSNSFLTETREVVSKAASALRRLAAQDQKPVAWQWRHPNGEWVDCDEPSPNELRDEPEKFRCLYLSPPLAAGWDEGLTNLQAWCENEGSKLGAVDGYDYRSGEEAAYRHVAIEIGKRLKALRHNAPPDTGAGKSAPSGEGSLPSGESVGPVMPDHGGADAGVRSDKTVINNWNGGGTLQTWTDGEWQILYAKDSAGNCVTLSLTSQDAIRLAYAVSPIPNEQFERLREANSAVHELSYPEARADELRHIADEIDCGGSCEECSQQKLDRGEFCGFVAADNLRKLASALDLKAALSKPAPVARYSIEFDGFTGTVIGSYTTLEGKEGVVLQQDGTRVVHVYGRKHLKPAPVAANASAEARLREALENTNQLLIDVMHDQEADIRDRASKQFDKNIDALSTHPHASDCDKQGDPRPANCRFRLQDEGKSYPRSSCSACGKNIATGLGNRCKEVRP